MLIKSNVKMNTLIPIFQLKNGFVVIVNASQTTLVTTLMSVLRTEVNVLVRKTMQTELAMNAQMGTLVILIANPVTVILVTQLKKYVIKLMENAHVKTDSAEEVVTLAEMSFMNIQVAITVDALQNIPRMHQIFAIKKMENAPAIKNMMVESAIVVKMNFMNIPVVIIVDA